MSILFVVTSNSVLGETGKRTGLWLEELLAPYYRMVDNGYTVDIVSPEGGEAPIDPTSVEAIEGSEIYQRYQRDEALKRLLKNAVKLSEIDSGRYDAAIYPGGHGPLWDLKANPDSNLLIKTLIDSGKPVGTICHAGCALLDVRSIDGEPLVKGRQVTAFSDSEEEAVQMTQHVPYLIETELKQLGAHYSKAEEDWGSHTVVDGVLVTGQNPASSGVVADEIINLLRSKG